MSSTAYSRRRQRTKCVSGARERRPEPSDETASQTTQTTARHPHVDYKLRILWPLAHWVEDHHGRETLDRVLEGTGVTRDGFESTHEWVSLETFETIVARARALMSDDDTFMRACAYRLKSAYGPIRHVLWATSPRRVYAQMVKTQGLVSAVGTLVCVSQGEGSFHLRVEPDGRRISRLTCLARQAQLRAMPTFWGLPQAHVREEACVALGDPMCELHMRWYVRRWAMPVLVAAVGFGLAGVLLMHVARAPASIAWTLTLLGAAIGRVVALQRSERLNRATRQEVIDALREVASKEAEARREMIELSERRKEWTRLVEEQMVEHTRTLEHVVDGMQELQQQRVTKVLGFSHDLRNPLQVVQFGAEVLRARFGQDEAVMGIVGDMEYAVDQMKRMLTELVKTANGQRSAKQFVPEVISISELGETIQRRIRALVYGRDVRATVYTTREAPSAIEIDPLLLDRIVDNLLTNAAKYTERGTIVLELDGNPGFFVLKISDTGCGIEPTAVDRIFEPGGSSLDSRRGDSHGVGLSVVVQLLDQIGGRLELMSRPGEGTTFWVHFPLQCDQKRTGDVRRSEPDSILSRVVRIRSISA